MMMRRVVASLALLSLALVQPVVPPAAAPADRGDLRAGAARIDVTPALADLPKPFTSVESHLYVRAVVLESGGQRAVLVDGDLPTIVADVFDNLVKQIAAEAHAPVANVLLAVTHTHNAVRLDNNPVGIILPGSAKVTKDTSAAIISAVRQAVARLEPARAGYALELSPPAGSPAVSQYGGRTFSIFKVESLKGQPIAMLVNNGAPSAMAYGKLKTQISADVPGVMERSIEQKFGDKPVVMFTIGAPPRGANNVTDRQRQAPAAPPADPVAALHDAGAAFADEILQAQGTIKTSRVLPISGMLEVLNCPGKATSPLNNPASCSDAPGATLPRCVFTDKDTGPVPLRYGVIRLGDLSLVQSDADILPNVWSRVVAGAPSAKLMQVSLVYGPVHYVVEDADYPSNSYQVTASMAKRGCAADGFVEGTLKMLQQGSGRAG